MTVTIPAASFVRCSELRLPSVDPQTNYAHWCSPTFDDTLKNALLSQQLSGRIENYDKAQQILARELPVLPLASSLRLQSLSA
ncbi:hypothetical protein WDV93_14285 [Pantoea ananatis]